MELRNGLKGGQNRLLFFLNANKIFLFFFQKGVDKLPELWYNKYRKRDRESPSKER